KSLAQTRGAYSRPRTVLRLADTDRRAVRWSIELAYLHFVQAEALRRSADQRLEHRRALHAARAALRAPGRCIGGDRNTAKAKRWRLVNKRCQQRRNLVVCLANRGRAVFD